MPTRAEAKVTTDHDEIRQWAEERGARPACVRNTGDEGDIGILRLDFPGYSGADSLEEISWEDFFDKFDERGLALLHQNTTARGQKSNFNKLISRQAADAQGGRTRSGGVTSARGRSASGRGRSKPASSSRGAGRKTTAKKSTGRGTRKSAGARGRKATAKKSIRAASTRSRSASAKRASGNSGTSSRRARTKSAASRGTRTTSLRSSSRGTGKKTTARKSASAGRTPSNRARKNTRGTTSNRRLGPIASRSQSRGGRSNAGSRILTDHDEIRRWAEERNANPACVRGTGRKKNDMGMIRLDFPGYSGARSLQEVDWEDWFRQFDENNLALVVQDSTARGQRSNFNKIIGRETAEERAEHGGHYSRRHPERERNEDETARIAGSRAQVKSTRGSNRGSRTASARGQHREQERRAA